ncbi:hypothetical protein ACIO3O_36880 [Streptomyces sp. NPDC087440]|uniref:hypothetical protein n=1 Tax=Streptomyces sp. NPDC087440 TaxID=3365790 RepID=UPI0037F68602
MKLEDLGPEYVRIAEARKNLEAVGGQVVEMAAGVDLGPLGTEDLPYAVRALGRSEFVDEEEPAARRVSEAFTATPMDMIPLGGDALALGGAVFVLRAALLELEEALDAVSHRGSENP